MGGLVIVTGGGRGIGAATALACASAGFDVCLSYRANEAAAQQVVAGCQQAGVRATAVRADVGVEADVLELFAVADRMGTVTALVNNAGIVAPASRLDDLSADRIDQMMRVNVLGAFLCAREAVRRMSTRHGGTGGSIVNVSSRAAVLGSAGEYVDYAASKAAVDTLTVGLAREVAREGIRVNAVRPGLIDTEIHETTSPGRLERLTPTVPMGRVGAPEEVAAAIVWLLSDAASFVTGALLDVSGGR
ncbi:MAG: SDR family oxidoreductase [Micromonosporaceae bacterium]|nr:SDR family oxidoreductase [Micromonosporaceae bacterium]